MNSHSKVIMFNKALMLIHYSILFAFSIPFIIIYFPYNNLLTLFVLLLWYGYLGIRIHGQVVKIGYSETEVIFDFLFGKTLKFGWEEIIAFSIYHYGRDVLFIKTQQIQIEIDTYYCKNQAEDIQKLITQNAGFVKNRSILMLTSFVKESKQ